MPFHAILGGQRGDEGKGRFVDLVASNYHVIARGNGGANAGHTIVPPGMPSLALHQIPSGIAYQDKLNIVGNGVFLDPVRFVKELQEVTAAGIKVTPHNLLISDAAHLVFPHHILLDTRREAGDKPQGSTKSGIAYVAAEKYLRESLRLEAITDSKVLFEHAYQGLVDCYKDAQTTRLPDARELEELAQTFVDSVAILAPYVTDTVAAVQKELEDGKLVLGEGAQAFGLDINHGMYPYVTSSCTTVSGLLDGLGIAPKHLEKVTLVIKSVKSHVGGGPFVTEITDEALVEKIRGPKHDTDSEYGATTKRPRRIGYLDLVELRKAIAVNGASEIMLSKLDHVPRYGSDLQIATAYNCDKEMLLSAPSSAGVLEKCQPVYKSLKNWQTDISAVRSFDQLPSEAQQFIAVLENELAIPITKIGVGPERDQFINR